MGQTKTKTKKEIEEAKRRRKGPKWITRSGKRVPPGTKGASPPLKVHDAKYTRGTR